VARIARNEALFRQVNEQIDAVNDWGAGASSFGIVCECGLATCGETIQIERARYEAVRRHAERFIVRPGHEFPDVEEVVEHGDGFDVVAKRPGLPRRLAEETDPRG
jgi:hypothetical protein